MKGAIFTDGFDVGTDQGALIEVVRAPVVDWPFVVS